jgi:DNA repair protein RecO
LNRQTSAAVVLRRWPYSETSQVVRMLTPEHGVLPMLAKGVNKLTSGQAGVLDTWALVEADFGGPDSRELLQLYKVKLLDRHSGISRDPDHITAAALLAEAAELACPSGLPSSPVFLFLVECLQELDGGTELDGFLCQRISQILSLLGLAPHLESLDHPSDSPLWFSPSGGGIMPPGSPRPTDLAYRLKPEQLELLKDFCSNPVKARQAPLSQVADCLTILGEFLCYHLERPPKAWAVLQQRRKAVAHS